MTRTAVFHPEWLVFEKTLDPQQQQQQQQQTIANPSIAQIKAEFGWKGVELVKQWPSLDEQLDISEETVEQSEDGSSFKVRIYRPRQRHRNHKNNDNGGAGAACHSDIGEGNDDNDDEDLPLMLYFHGGGFLCGDLETEHPHCCRIAAKTPCIVVNVDYPLAPEHEMDQIIRAGLRSIKWAQSHIPPLTTSRKLLLGGGSSGATLALQLAYHYAVIAAASPFSSSTEGEEKDDHDDKNNDSRIATIAGLVLIQPTCSPSALTPYTGPYCNEHTSVTEKGEGLPMLDRTAMLHLIRVPKTDPTSPRHFPLLAPSLACFAVPRREQQQRQRIYIVTAEHDPARDDGRILAKRLREETTTKDNNSSKMMVEVREDYYVGMPHWFQWFPTIPMAHVMMDKTVEAIRWIVGE